jgi:hypothetical protein
VPPGGDHGVIAASVGVSARVSGDDPMITSPGGGCSRVFAPEVAYPQTPASDRLLDLLPVARTPLT